MSFDLFVFFLQLFERILEIPIMWSKGRASGEVLLVQPFCYHLPVFPFILKKAWWVIANFMHLRVVSFCCLYLLVDVSFW